jgi:glutamyl-tRNA reductase
MISGLIVAALRPSKRARTDTTISTEGISLARAGLDRAAGHLGRLAARHAVVLGTGSMGKFAARLLREAGVLVSPSAAGGHPWQPARAGPG